MTQQNNPSLDVSFMKYLKYKQKYYQLKNMLGGDDNDNLLNIKFNSLESSTNYCDNKIKVIEDNDNPHL